MRGDGRACVTRSFEGMSHACAIARVAATCDVDDGGERIEFVGFVGVFAQIDVEGDAVHERIAISPDTIDMRDIPIRHFIRRRECHEFLRFERFDAIPDLIEA